MTSLKFEKIAEVKADYEFMLKKLSKNKEKMQEKKKERDEEIKQIGEDIDQQK